MAWAHAIGVYLLAGTVFYGLGLLARKGWVMSGKTPPIRGKRGWMSACIGVTIGVLFWPAVFAVVIIGRRMSRRAGKVERILGFCEHATAWEPYCGPCRRDVDREDSLRKVTFRVGRPIREIVGEMDARCRGAVASYIQAHPACPKCGKTGTLAQYLDSLWVKCSGCGRRTFTPDSSVPEEVDMVPAWPSEGVLASATSFYECSVCGTRSEGVPPGADAEGQPLCVPCKIAHLRTQR